MKKRKLAKPYKSSNKRLYKEVGSFLNPHLEYLPSNQKEKKY